ncbi:MAG: glutamine--fructose-6-phosphate transaminase (isomerizing) [Nanoarchaeota archaeon]
MCGIIGLVSKEEFDVNDSLIGGLKRLEYRGYDSWGFASSEGNLIRATGEITYVETGLHTKTGIAHTRWATNGCVNKENAHPHFNAEKTIFAVHNGIIENSDEIKRKLEKKGYGFVSETDTEIIPHFFDYKQGKGKDMKDAMFDFFNEVKGTFAILLIKKDENRIYAMKRDSPLVLGVCNGKNILSSDVYAFSDASNKAIFFEDNEFAVIESDNYEFYDSFGKRIKKEIKEFEWEVEEQTKKDFQHYMLKEIHEEANVAKRLIQSLETNQHDNFKKFSNILSDSQRIVFVSCGTSYHAALIGSFILNKIGIQSQAVIASESENFVDIDKKTTVIAISQSGETMDVVVVLKKAAKKGARILSIVNVPYSTVQRHSNVSLEIMAGQEICVAATKTFTNQLITLFAIAKELGYNTINLKKIPLNITRTIHKTEIKLKKLAKELKGREHIFVLGRGVSYPIAREFALKLKEIPYIHAEGMMGGELKHGTIALVEKGTLVICLIPNDNPDIKSNTKEVEARGARTIIVSNTKDGEVKIEKSDDAEFSIYSSIVGHLLSYYIARLKGLPIDKPRNLAKSVTVK